MKLIVPKDLTVIAFAVVRQQMMPVMYAMVMALPAILVTQQLSSPFLRTSVPTAMAHLEA